MSEQAEVLSIAEQTTISNAVLDYVAEYNAFPTTITVKRLFWQYMDNAECIGIYTMAGAIYLKKYISGSFEAQFPFCVRYKCKPTTNKARIDKQSVLDNLGVWMENGTYPTLTDNRTIETITRTGTTYLVGNDESGNEIYQCNFNLKYLKKKG